MTSHNAASRIGALPLLHGDWSLTSRSDIERLVGGFRIASIVGENVRLTHQARSCALAIATGSRLCELEVTLPPTSLLRAELITPSSQADDWRKHGQHADSHALLTLWLDADGNAEPFTWSTGDIIDRCWNRGWDVSDIDCLTEYVRLYLSSEVTREGRTQVIESTADLRAHSLDDPHGVLEPNVIPEAADDPIRLMDPARSNTHFWVNALIGDSFRECAVEVQSDGHVVVLDYESTPFSRWPEALWGPYRIRVPVRF